MKHIKKFLYVSIFLLLASNATGEDNEQDEQDANHQDIEQQDQDLEHEKRMFKSSDGKIYINKSLPVYLHLSTSPDKDGEAVLLESKKTSQCANPMYFDTEGLNTIRHPWAIDNETGELLMPKQEVIFEVYADGISPTTRSKFSGAKSYTNNGKKYYGKNLKINFTSYDKVSGVQDIYYRLDESSAFLLYKDSIAADKEGASSIKFYAIDFVGNVEHVHSEDFIVDATSPDTKINIIGDQKANIVSPRSALNLAFEDNLTGVSRCMYHIDEDTERPYETKIKLNSIPEGEHSITYYSEDFVDNAEESNVFKFYMDRTPPEVEASIEGDQYKHYVSPRSKVRLEGTDNKAGVKSVTYTIDMANEKDYGKLFPVTDKLGFHTISYYGTDNVENKGKKQYKRVFMDNIPPVTNLKVKGPEFFARDTVFISKSTSITLDAKDMHSGVKTVEFVVDNDQTSDYREAFNLNDEGFHKIQFNATDNVNNKEKLKTSSFYVDNVPPEIYVNFSIEPISKEVEKDGKTYEVYPNYTRMYIGATDEKCGTAKINYSINDNQLTEYSSPHTLDVSEASMFKEQKHYTVKIICEDKLGNQSEKTIEFYVKNM